MNKQEQYKEARKIIERRQNLGCHIIASIICGLAFFFTNKILAPNIPWSRVILIAWIAVLFFHIMHTFLFESRNIFKWEEKRMKKRIRIKKKNGYLLRKERKKEIMYREISFLSHFLAYLVGNILFLFVNLLFIKDLRWLMPPLLIWGAGIIIHFINLQVIKSNLRDGWENKTRLAIERRIDKYNNLDTMNNKNSK